MGPQGVTNKKKAHYYCIMKLEVHIPGREPYVTLMRKTLRPEERVGLGPGSIIQVRIDPHGDPKNVRMDLGQAIA